MKIKVLIVDDEQLSVKYISGLINWSVYGMELIPSASNGREALQLYEKYRPDIVITDITMPVMNGIELAHNIRSFSENTYIIFLTAYNDFKYALDAVRLGASDYILKDEIFPDYLRKKLLNICAEYTKLLQHTRTVFEYEVSHYFSGASEKNTEGLSNKVIDMLNSAYHAAIIEQDMPLECITSVLGVEPKKAVEYSEVRALIRGLEQEGEKICLSQIAPGKFLLLYNYNGEKNRAKGYQNFRAAMSRTYKSLSENSDCRFSVFFFLDEYKLEKLYSKYKENINVFKRKYLFAENKPVAFEELPRLNCNKVKPDLTEFKKAMVNLSAADAVKILENIFSSAVSEHNYFTLDEMFSGVLLYIKHNFSETELAEANITEPSGIEAVTSYKAAFEWLKGVITTLADNSGINNSKKYSRIIHEAIDYIKKNYSDSDLSIDDVAENTHLCRSWLSVQFKRETGKTIVEYLTEYRISVSKKLLNNDYKIFEIAEMTGFSNSQYFCKVFKKMEGVSPVEYKNRK